LLASPATGEASWRPDWCSSFGNNIRSICRQEFANNSCNYRISKCVYLQFEMQEKWVVII
jgi:hypothetical protein